MAHAGGADPPSQEVKLNCSGAVRCEHGLRYRRLLRSSREICPKHTSAQPPPYGCVDRRLHNSAKKVGHSQRRHSGRRRTAGRGQKRTDILIVILRIVKASWRLRRVWRPIRLGLVFVAAQGLLANLVIMGLAVFLVDVLGAVAFDFHGKTISDLPPTAGLVVGNVALALALGCTLVAWRWIEGRRFRDLGWGRRGAAGRAIALGGAVGAISPIVVFAAGLAL